MAADNIAMAAYLTIIMIIPAKNVMEAKHAEHAEHEQAVTPQQALTIDRQLTSEDTHVPDNVASALKGNCRVFYSISIALCAAVVKAPPRLSIQLNLTLTIASLIIT